KASAFARGLGSLRPLVSVVVERRTRATTKGRDVEQTQSVYGAAELMRAVMRQHRRPHGREQWLSGPNVLADAAEPRLWRVRANPVTREKCVSTFRGYVFAAMTRPLPASLAR